MPAQRLALRSGPGQATRATPPARTTPSASIGAPRMAAPTPATTVAATRTPLPPNWPRSVSRPHSQPMSPAPTSVTAARSAPPSHAATIASGARTDAERMRSRRASDLEASSDCAIAPLAAVKLAEGALEIRLGEIRPERVDEHEFRIGRLPQQEVAEPLFAAGADDEIGVRHVRSEQVAREHGLVDPRGVEATCERCLGNPPRGAGDLGPSAIGERHREVEAGIAGGKRLGVVDKRHDVGRQTVAVANHAHADIV